MAYKPFIVLPSILVLILSFTVVCAQPPPPDISRFITPIAAVPTATPRGPTPTISQKETVTAIRSAEIFAKQTATARYRSKVATVRPTVTPSPPTVAPRSSGLGVSRRSLRDFYENDLDFDCIGGIEIRGYGRGYETWKCYSHFSSSVDVDLEIIGALTTDNVIDSRLIVYNPHDDGLATATHTALFLSNVVPRWEGSLDWVDNNILSAVDGELRSITNGDTVLTMQFVAGAPVEFILGVKIQ